MKLFYTSSKSQPTMSSGVFYFKGFTASNDVAQAGFTTGRKIPAKDNYNFPASSQQKIQILELGPTSLR